MLRRVLFTFAVILGCASSVSAAENYKPPVYKDGPCYIPPKGQWILVTVSWYGPGFHGKSTAAGKRYDQNKISAAHPCLPLGTQVVFHKPDTKLEVVVPVNDRGPYDPEKVPAGPARLQAKNLIPHPVREFDLSKAAARKFGFIGPGTTQLYIWVL